MNLPPSPQQPTPEVDVPASEALVVASADIAQSCKEPFARHRRLATRLGARVVNAREGRVQFGFWVPHLMRFGVSQGDVFLELLRPLDDVDLTASRRKLACSRHLLPVQVHDDHVWVEVTGLRVGHRDALGDLYQLRYRERDGRWRVARDVLAASVPWGAFAPAEVYDVDAMHEGRADADHFAVSAHDDGRRMGPADNILQVHVGTATLGGTLASLTRRIQEIGERLRGGVALEPADTCFLGYDAIQLLPVEPTTVFEAGPSFFQLDDDDEGDLARVIEADIRRPYTTNWGYDVVIAGSAAVNPALLESGRPDELVDLAVALHTFPTGPIKLIFDVVFGHCDNQALAVLNHNFFAGPNMYGQDLSFRHPAVRAILLELQRRKVNFGADGVRVDGAQDFKVWDAEQELLLHDDDYLCAMAELPQEVCGHAYQPWYIFEDGRPWPRPDWELASTYLDVIEQLPDAFQWGPLTFAHNTPFLYTFWLNKWWRLQEILHHGENWINGTANHDTVRRGTQVNPRLQINTRLGDTLLEILDNAYDHPAATMLLYLMLPGVPMDFLQASMRVPWGFVRNADDKYGVKVVAEESTFLEWQVDDDSFNKNWQFRRLKSRGFDKLEDLRRFMLLLRTSVEATDYDLHAICDIMRVSVKGHPACDGLDVDKLKQICRDYMDDLHAYCNVDYHRDDLAPHRVAYNFALREARHQRPWLRQSLSAGERLERRTPARGSAFFYGVRRAPDDSEHLLFAANMEGDDVTTSLQDLAQALGVGARGWSVLLSSPGLDDGALLSSFVMRDGQAVCFSRVARDVPTPPLSEVS